MATTEDKRKRSSGDAKERARLVRLHNELELDLWLLYVGGVPKERLEKLAPSSNKSTSEQVEANLAWIDACQDPHARESHAILTEIVLRRMPEEKPIHYRLLEWVSFGADPHFAEPELWRRRMNKNKTFANLFWLLDAAREWILDELGDHVLYVPDPYRASEHAETSRRKQRTARRTYLKVLDETDGDDKKAREAAMRASGYSYTQLWRIIPVPEEKRRLRG